MSCMNETFRIEISSYIAFFYTQAFFLHYTDCIDYINLKKIIIIFLHTGPARAPRERSTIPSLLFGKLMSIL